MPGTAQYPDIVAFMSCETWCSLPWFGDESIEGCTVKCLYDTQSDHLSHYSATFGGSTLSRAPLPSWHCNANWHLQVLGQLRCDHQRRRLLDSPIHALAKRIKQIPSSPPILHSRVIPWDSGQNNEEFSLRTDLGIGDASHGRILVF